MTEQSMSDLYKGMAKFRSQLKQPVKDGTNPYFKNGYVTLSGVQKSIDEALKDTGLAYVQLVSNDPSGNVGVETIITHASGQSISSGVLVLMPAKKDAQSYGSSITYAKRYQLSAMFGVSSDDDDDGNAAINTPRKTNAKQYQKKQPANPPSQQKEMTKEDKLKATYHEKLNTLVNASHMQKDKVIAMVMERAKKSYPTFMQMNNSQKLEISNICLDMMIEEFGGNSNAQ